jgi:uncharacterized small protein (DUF1192 family)
MTDAERIDNLEARVAALEDLVARLVAQFDSAGIRV